MLTTLLCNSEHPGVGLDCRDFNKKKHFFLSILLFSKGEYSLSLPKGFRKTQFNNNKPRPESGTLTASSVWSRRLSRDTILYNIICIKTNTSRSMDVSHTPGRRIRYGNKTRMQTICFENIRSCGLKLHGGKARRID